MPLKVIIVGAGIAGVCAALALRRQGCEVEIFEKSAFATEIGAALALSPNGAQVLESLGFSFTHARACKVKAWDMCDGQTLNNLASVDLSRTKHEYGADHWTVHRVDLHNELLRLATVEFNDGQANGSGNPVKLTLGTEVVQATPDGTVVLHDGSICVADLVVAADGLHSVLRDVVLGPDVTHTPKYSGSAAFRFLADTDVLKKDKVLAQLLESRQGKATMLVDTRDQVDRHMVWYACRDGKTQNFVGIHPSDTTRLAEGEDAKSSMTKEFAHFHENIYRILSLSEHVKCWPLFMHDPYPTWIRGRIILIGDAAHPMLPFGGQGSNIAIEDGGALGILFRGLTDANRVEQRLALFERVRRNRVSRVQILSSVRANLENTVEAEVRRYTDSPDDPVPSSMVERSVHDHSYDALAAIENALQEEEA